MAENTFQQNAYQQDAFQRWIISVATFRDKPRVEPIYLVEITLKNSGPTLYFSDRNILVGSHQYENYIKEISGIEGEINRIDSSFLNSDINIIFKNDRYASYDYLILMGDTYPFEGAECRIKETYLDDNDNPSDTVTIFCGVIDEPKDIDLLNFQCSVSSIIFSKDKLWNVPMIDIDTYPYAYEDIGKLEPFIYGSNILVPALKIDFGEKTTLYNYITATSTANLELSDASRFPSSGGIYIDKELVTYTGKDGTNPNLLTGVTRGVNGTTATIHDSGAEVWENLTQYDSMVASHECATINKVYAKVGDYLYRVEDIDNILVGGKQYLRATNQIKLDISESIEVAGNIHAHGTLGVTTTTLYMEVDDVDSDYNLGDENPNNVRDNNLSTYTRLYKINTSAAAKGNHEMWRTSDWSIGGSSIVEVRLCYRAMRTNTGRVSWDCSWNGAFIGSSSWPTIYEVKTVKSVATGIGATDWAKLKDVIHFNFYIQAYGENPVEAWEYEVYLEVDTSTPTQNGGSGIVKAGGIISTQSVDRLYTDVDGYKDPDGNYGGYGNVIERPDYVIKHFLVQKLGFALTDIDTTSFGVAGTWYGTNSYKLGFAISDTITPSDFLNRLAFECRSTLRYIAGVWYLNVIPDTSPASIATITASELTGQYSTFKFGKTPITDIANDITAKFKRDYSKLIANNSDWLLTSKTLDTNSKNKYGTHHKDFEFEYVRDQSTADNVLAHILLQRKIPLLIVTLSVFWDYFYLNEGDTFDILNLLYNSKKFYIEKFRRIDKFKAEIIAKEWYN